MAYDYAIDRDQSLVYVRMYGPLTLAEIREAGQKIASHPEVTAGFGELIDLRDATTDAVKADDVRDIAAAPLNAATRRAFVTSDVLTYGLARMFEIYRELNRKQEEVAVFRDITDAERWLGVTRGSETRDRHESRSSSQ